MKFENPISGAILIVGSLCWDDHVTRKALRNKFLSMSKAKSVPAPIRYGRKSDLRNTVTMVFSNSCVGEKMGHAKLVPFQNKIASSKELDEITKAIIKAEHKKEPSFNRFNWEWGCLAVLVNPKAGIKIAKSIKDYWSEKIGKKFDPNEYKIGKEKTIVSSNGLLQIDWHNEYGDLDFVVVTATKPNIVPIPSSKDLSVKIIGDPTYFENNRKEVITTYQDAEIANFLLKKNSISNELNGWRYIPLSEVVDKPVVYGIVQAGPEVPNGIPYIKSTDVGASIDITTLSRTSSAIAKKYKRSQVEPRDIVFSLRGDIGELSIVPDSLKVANLTQGTARISVDEKEFDHHFIAYCLQSPQVTRHINKVSKGSTFKEISLDQLRKIMLLVPSRSEQVQIAGLIITWDKSIENLARSIDLKTIETKWLMQQLLLGGKRLKGFSKKWQEYHLRDFFDERNEFNYIHLPLLSIGQDGVYPQSQSDKRDISNEDKSKYRRICKGDIGYNTMRMWQGRSALSTLEGIVSPAYTILKPKRNAYSPFFAYLFQTKKLIHAFFRNSQGLVEDTLNCKYQDFAIVKIHLPELEEQIAIARVLLEAKTEIELLTKKLNMIREQKKGLMQILLTGKKRIKL